MRICLQAGHKNMLIGATGAPGEKEFTSSICDAVKKELDKRGFESVVCDAFANKNKSITETDWDLFLAVHYDADVYKDSGGFVDFADPSTDLATKESQRIAKILSDEYFKTTGIKNMPQRSNANTRFYYMWSSLSAKTPCVLIECGVGWRKPKDHDILHGNRPLVVAGIVKGICEAFDVKYEDDDCDEIILELKRERDAYKKKLDEIKKIIGA